MDILKYLKSEGMSFDDDTCMEASQGGIENQEVLKYLKSEGVDVPDHVNVNALTGGLETFRL